MGAAFPRSPLEIPKISSDLSSCYCRSIDSYFGSSNHVGLPQELRAQKAAENRRRTEMVRKQREDARVKKEAEQRQREAKLQQEQRRRIAAEKKKVLLYATLCAPRHTIDPIARNWHGQYAQDNSLVFA